MEKEGSNIYENLTKKEIQMLNRERIKLADQHRGIKDMKRLPDVVVVVDANHEITAVQEARLLEIPVVGIVDTNTDPNSVDYPIPANDDSIRTIQLIIAAISDEILSSADKENVSENVEPETQENVDEVVDVSAGENGKAEQASEEVVESTDKIEEDIKSPEVDVADKDVKKKVAKNKNCNEEKRNNRESRNKMSISALVVKELREKTGAGMMDCKKALIDSNGDIEKAVDFLRKAGIAKAEKKGSRDVKEGIVYSYIHHGGRLGVLVEVNCETDFVAKTDGFKELVHNIAMQIAATNPVAVSSKDISEDLIEKEKEIFTAQAKDSGKPDNIIEKIVEGRVQKYFQEVCLVEQPFIKDPDKRVGDLITETVATLGENITIGRYIRYAVGESLISSNGQA